MPVPDATALVFVDTGVPECLASAKGCTIDHVSILAGPPRLECLILPIGGWNFWQAGWSFFAYDIANEIQMLPTIQAESAYFLIRIPIAPGGLYAMQWSMNRDGGFVDLQPFPVT